MVVYHRVKSDKLNYSSPDYYLIKPNLCLQTRLHQACSHQMYKTLFSKPNTYTNILEGKGYPLFNQYTIQNSLTLFGKITL